MSPPPEPRPGPGIIAPELLDQCISCGFCLPACPTYQLTGDEAASPRGRINLLRALEAGDLPPDDPALAEQASFCLGCRACEPVCPAGVQYGTMLEQWRDHQWRGRRRPLLVRLIAAVVGRGWLVRMGGRVRRAARTRPAEGAAQLLLGCAERVLFPKVSRAARALAPELAVPDRQDCCGALHAHNGELERGQELARRLGEQLPGRIVTTSGGCAAHLAAVLGSERVRELSAYLMETGRPAPVGGSPQPQGTSSAAGPAASGRWGELRVAGRRARVALQDSCHLRNALDGWREPRELLRQVADYVELPDAAGCCGAAGTYALLRRGDSARVLAPKLDQIESAGVDYVAVVNPGCLRQLRQGLRRRRSRVRAVHLAELLTWTEKRSFQHERHIS